MIDELLYCTIFVYETVKCQFAEKTIWEVAYFFFFFFMHGLFKTSVSKKKNCGFLFKHHSRKMA